MVAMPKRAGLPWDCVITADVVQTYKPDPKAYLTGIRLLGGDPAAAMLVAAHNSTSPRPSRTARAPPSSRGPMNSDRPRPPT